MYLCAPTSSSGVCASATRIVTAMTNPQPILDALRRRRSIRYGFDDRPIARGELAEVITCGLAAPSSKNAQPWRFHVVTDRATLRALADAVASAPTIDTYVPHDPRTGE